MHKPRKLTTFGILLRLLLLITAVSAQFSIKARYWDQHYPETVIVDYSDLLLQSVPDQVKGMSAGLMRLTADEYMHIGPYKKARQNFIAGSYAGNTEIMTLLRLALYLEPTHIDTYTIMSQNLAMYLDRFEEGIRLLQQGILANKQAPELHKLYAAGAYCHGFAESYTYSSSQPIKNNREVALNYLEAAIKSYEAQAMYLASDSYDVFANIDNYRLLKSRFLLDVGKREEALAAWRLVPAQNRSGLLATYFSLLEQGVDVPATPEQMFDEILKSSTKTEKEPPYQLPDGWYQTLFVEPADTFKAVANILDRSSAAQVDELNPFATSKAGISDQSTDEQHKHEEDDTCGHTNHSEHDCPHHHNTGNEWPIFKEARAAILQAALMFVCGLGIRRFFTRR